MSKFDVNRDLLDSEFSGYKLTLDALPIYNSELDIGSYDIYSHYNDF